MNKWVAFIAAKRQYIARVAAGQFIWAAISWIYNNPLYIAAVAWYGPVVGGGVMTIGSLIICWGMVLWYNRKGVDWLGVGAADSVRDLAANYAEKLSAWRASSLSGQALYLMFVLPIRSLVLLTRLAKHKTYGDVVAFLLLSILLDPFITISYLRHGVYGSMSKREWAIFFASVLLSNGYWIVRTTIIIEIFTAVLRHF
jgi:hypothetical protein